MVGHDDERVELELAGVAVAEDRCDEEFGDGVALEDSATLVRDGSQGVGLGFEAHHRKACPRG